MGRFGNLVSEGKNDNYIKLRRGDDDDYMNLIKKSDKLVIVDFSAQWCGPCNMMGPQFQKMADEFPNCVLVKLDVDDLDDIAEAAGIKCMPTFHFYKNGQKVDEFSGANHEKLRDTITNNLKK